MRATMRTVVAMFALAFFKVTDVVFHPYRTFARFTIKMHYASSPMSAFLTARSYLTGNDLYGTAYAVALEQQARIACLTKLRLCPNCGWVLLSNEDPCYGKPFKNGEPPHQHVDSEKLPALNPQTMPI